MNTMAVSYTHLDVYKRQAVERLPAGTDIMGIYGAAHTDPTALSWDGTVDSMAKQLAAYYGDKLHCTDLTQLPAPTITEEDFAIAGKHYTATWLGGEDASVWSQQYQSRTCLLYTSCVRGNNALDGV